MSSEIETDDSIRVNRERLKSLKEKATTFGLVFLAFLGISLELGIVFWLPLIFIGVIYLVIFLRKWEFLALIINILEATGDKNGKYEQQTKVLTPRQTAKQTINEAIYVIRELFNQGKKRLTNLYKYQPRLLWQKLKKTVHELG